MSASLTSVRLEYAPTSDRAPLGGVFFKPSYQSLLLLLVAALSILWLVRRHAPWRLFAEIPADQWLSTNPLVTPDHHLLVADRQTGLVLYDLSTGKPIRTVFPSLNLGSAYIALNGGRRIAVFTRKAPTIAVYDTSTAELVAQLPNPCPDASFQLSPDGKRMATPVPKTGEVLIWDLTSNLPVSQMQPMRRVATYGLWFANGGREILINGRFEGMRILNANDLHTVFDIDYSPDQSAILCSERDDAGPFVPIMIPFYPSKALPCRFELRSTSDGRLIDSCAVTTRDYVFWSSDLAVKVVCRNSRFSSPTHALDFFDRASGRKLKSDLAAEANRLTFFPVSSRYIATHVDGPRTHTAIYDLHRRQPIANLDVFSNVAPRFSISPDGQTIIAGIYGNRVQLYQLFHPTGRDCPESHLGILAFPQTWLIIFFVTAAALSLLKDAQRSRSLSALPPARLMSIILFALALVLTLRFTLEACLGHLIYSGAPALLICAIGLATGSRVWRFLTLAGLCATLPLYLYYLNQMRNTGLRTIQAWPLFDRIYELPQSLPFAIFLLTTLAVLAAIVQFARPRPALLS